MEEVFICSAARTPIGQFLGQFKNTSPVDLGVAAVSEAIKRANVNVENVDELILGHVLSAGHGQNPARQVGIKAGLPERYLLSSNRIKIMEIFLAAQLDKSLFSVLLD